MNKDLLRKTCEPYFLPRNLEQSKILLNHYLEYLFLVIRNHGNDPVYTRPEADAKMILQMVFVKTTHILKILEGVGFEAKDGTKLNEIVDPTILASLIRNLYETVCLFHLIYIDSNSVEERDLIYSLWAISGLNYRQRFKKNAYSDENIKKQQEEEKAIIQLSKEVFESQIFLGFGEADQNKIRQKIKEKDYKIRIKNNKVNFESWQSLSEIMGFNQEFFGNIYTYFSLYAHPSHVSVFQFANMFGKKDETFKSLANTNLNYCFTLLSAFVADSIKLFPKVKETFESLPKELQIIFNWPNTNMRKDGYSINDAWKALE
ncbi:MAG: hypothetical protein H6581_30480 [Bacteroidia bacterium]|nr:hypothetical protein [Bacteroidia bacterium]